MKKTLLIITANQYPNKDAGAVRQHAMAKLFAELGYDVSLIGYGDYTGPQFCRYDGVSYTSLRIKSTNTYMRLIARFLFGSRMMRLLKKMPVPNVILVVDILPDGFKKITRYAKKHGCMLLHDSVEWYSPEEFAKGERDVQYRLKEYTNTKAICHPWRVLAISQYLEQHFRSQHISTMRIPVIMDMETIVGNCQLHNPKVRFVYAGSPGRKDFLKEIIGGFALLEDSVKQTIELHIVGISEKALVEVCGVDEQDMRRVQTCLIVHGRLPRNETVRIITQSDYSLLLRNNDLRYAKAGFPTKIVESLACATPPVCNISSDLGMYLSDGYNAVVIDGYTKEAVYTALKRAVCLSEDVRNTMRKCARNTAEEYFDYRQYKQKVAEWMHER